MNNYEGHMKELEKLVYYGDLDEARELFCMGCRFYRCLEGTPKTWREQVLKMLKAMCKQSVKDLIEWGDDPKTTILKINGLEASY